MILFLFRKGSILLVEETEVIYENNQPATINVQMLSHKFFYRKTSYGWNEINNLNCEWHWLQSRLLSLPNKVWETYCFCSVSYYYYYYSLPSPFFPWTMNLSTADFRNYWTEFYETWWSYRYMFLVGPKVFNFVVKRVNVICWGVQRGGSYYRILWESWNFVH
jgi:hypothetical protein